LRVPWPPTLSAWLQRSVRHKLLAMALGPLLVVFPVLVLALSLWSTTTYDRLLITKVRSDLAVARGYFNQLLTEVGTGTAAVADSRRLTQWLPPHANDWPAPAALATRTAERTRFLETERTLRHLDFLHLEPISPPPSATGETPRFSALVNARRPLSQHAQLVVLEAGTVQELAPELASRLNLALVPTPNAAPTDRTQETRALVAMAVQPVLDAHGHPAAWLVGGVLLNQNLDFIDHINHIVYPEGSLPFGSQGTATLFLDDVRITTNVRLFEGERAIGTRVSQQVRDAVLGQGQTWLDRAFVVNDWYVSGYEPLLGAEGQRIGMLYVGVLEGPFRTVRLALVAVMALIFLVAMALAALLSLRWARSIFQPVEQMNRTMQQVEDGDAHARVGPLAAQDELGALAHHFDELLDRMAQNTEALRRWGQELDQRVAERTNELAASNASLRQTQEQLVRSEKLAVMGQLAASVAHEINNPLAVMQGNLDWMRDTLGHTADPVRTEMRLLDEQIERMRLIVQQLLQHARPEEYAGYTEGLDVNDVVKACLVLVNHRLSQTRIAMDLDLQAHTPVPCNRQELQQVVINLLINAVAAMPQGGTLWVRTLSVDGGSQITVTDCGPGLSEAVQSQLFQPFFTTKREGNGLGLWISRGLVERYGGRLTACNRPDATGAEFCVWLPESKNE